MIWTLKYGEEQKPFADWGIKNPRCRRRSQDVDVLTFDAPGQASDADPLFAYGETVEVYRNDVRWFVGRVTTIPRSGSARSDSISYEVAGPWWWLDQLVYQQEWGAIIDLDDPDNSVQGQFQSHVIVYQSRVGGWIGIRGQIQDVVAYAVGSGAPMQLSTDIPDVLPAKEEIRDVPCAEIIRRALRWIPDSVTWFDYSTTPPTLHIRRRAVLDAAALDFNAGNLINSHSIQARYDIQTEVVVLKYERTDQVDGRSFRGVFTDKYPLDANERQPGAMIATVDLLGVRSTSVRATVTSALVRWYDTAWWKSHMSWANRPEIVLEITTVAMDGGQPIPIAQAIAGPVDEMPFELLTGQIAPWMPNHAARRVRLSARANVGIKDAQNQIYAQQNDVELALEMTLTDCPSGTYTTLQSLEAGETPPVGLAQAVFEAVGTLHYQGDVTLVDEEVPNSPRLGQVLNFTGSRAEWSGMRALIQQTEEDLDSGTLHVTFGPPGHLGPSDLLEMLRVNRQRTMWTNPALQSDPFAGQSGEVGLGTHTPIANTTTSPGLTSVQSFGGGDGTGQAVTIIDPLGWTGWPAGRTRMVPIYGTVTGAGGGAAPDFTGYIMTLQPAS